MDHLIDADSASNTLSWRWVAGLHTRGKHYLARAENIEKFTNGKWNPRGQLDENAEPLISSGENPGPATLDLPKTRASGGRVGFLRWIDDLSDPPLSIGEVTAEAVFAPPNQLIGTEQCAFLEAAAQGTAQRAGAVVLGTDFKAELKQWIETESLERVVLARPHVGPAGDFWKGLELDIPVDFFVRSWDRSLWPHATAGFFKFRKKLPKFFEQIADT